jgi:hypothetical protein
MTNIIKRIISPTWHPRRAAAAGFAATIAYSIAMEGDMSITGNRFSDVRFIQRVSRTSNTLIATARTRHLPICPQMADDNLNGTTP